LGLFSVVGGVCGVFVNEYERLKEDKILKKKIVIKRE
jgi:hypothetical protein